MGFSKPPGVPCPPNNPHCQGEIPNVPIENYLFMAIIIVLITIYIFYIMKKKQENTDIMNVIEKGTECFRLQSELMKKESCSEKPKVKITVAEIEKLNAISKEVNKSWFDQVSTFLFGAKSFKWGELKGL